MCFKDEPCVNVSGGGDNLHIYTPRILNKARVSSYIQAILRHADLHVSVWGSEMSFNR